MKDCYLDMDELLAQKIWRDSDGNYLPIEDIPNRRVFAIEKQLKKAVESGASEHVRKWYVAFAEEAELRRSMMK